MGGFACMDGSIDAVASNVFRMYLYSFSKETSKEEKIEKLAKKYNLSVDEVEKIVNWHEDDE